VVHQVQRDNVFVNIDQAELRLPKGEQIFSERYRRGDTVRSIIKSVEITSKGPDIVVSRSDNHFLNKLFEMEVPEIEDGIIDITSIARQPGERAKIIVKSNDRRIDPVGACVGMRGSRIQAVVRELNNEKIDIVNFSEQPEVLITRALSPAKPVNLYIDEEKEYCIAIFDDESLDFAIGRKGMNINLASSVTGYSIDAYGVNQYKRLQDDQNTLLADIDGVTKKLGKYLADNNINTVNDLMDVEEESLAEIKGISSSDIEDIYSLVQAFVEREIEEDEEVNDLDDGMMLKNSNEEEE